MEMLVAIFILIVGIVGSYSAFTQIIIVTSAVSSKLTAAYLAQEGVEIIRNIRDTNWLQGFNQDNGLSNICSVGCEADYTTGTNEETTELKSYTGNQLCINSDGFYNYFSGSLTDFKRKITVELVDSDILKVSSEVYWEDRGKSYNFTAEERLYDWY